MIYSKTGVPKDQRKSVKTLTADMWLPSLQARKQVFPQAQLIDDRFHWLKHYHHGIDQTRRWEVKEHPDVLKNNRYAVLKNLENRTEKQKDLFKNIVNANLKVGIAYQSRERV